MRFPLLASLVSILLFPAAVYAAAPRSFLDLANMLVILMDNATIVLIVFGIVVYFYGISTNILKMSDEGGEKMKAYFFWGVIVLFLMVSVWGVLRLLQATLFGSGGAVNPASGTNDTRPSGFFSPQFHE